MTPEQCTAALSACGASEAERWLLVGQVVIALAMVAVLVLGTMGGGGRDG